MRCVLITSGMSNSGKTVVSMGIIRALKNRGLDVSAFKTGPDYIDTAYASHAAGKTGGNLDIHMMGREGLAYSLGLNESDYGIVEGAMGYFDGTYNTFENSSYDISNQLGIPGVLVYTLGGEMFSAVVKIKGMVDFPGSNLKGIILNKCHEKIYEMIAPQIEKYCGIKVLGYIPHDEEFSISSRHLGLMQAHEVEDLDRRMDYLASVIEEHVDLDGILELTREVETRQYEIERRELTIAVAKDKCFSFHYNENIALMERYGRVIYFSPLGDEVLPEADLYIIGGGYPELHLDELSANKSMIESIRTSVEDGAKFYVYGGGFMYFSKSIDGVEMCGIFDGVATMTKRLQRFGYSLLELIDDCMLGSAGTVISGNESHYSQMEIDMEPHIILTKPGRDVDWRDGYEYKNAFGHYQHINFVGNINVLENIIK